MASGPFDFDLCTRNAYLESKGIKPPRFTKTGTTIVGLIFNVRCPSSLCPAHNMLRVWSGSFKRSVAPSSTCPSHNTHRQ